jgi:hypothetical protein
MSRRVLITYQRETTVSTSTRGYKKYLESTLNALGYTPEFIEATDGSTYLASFADVSHGYEFIIWIQIQGSLFDTENASTILDGTAVIPTFIMMPLNDSGSTGASAMGVDRVTTYSGRYKWLDHVDGFSYPSQTAEYQRSDNTNGTGWTPITTFQVEEGTAGAGKTLFSTAKKVGTKTSIYFDGGGTVSYLFPMLLQSAINDAVLTAPDKKLILTHDVDDVPDSLLTLADISDLYDVQAQYRMPMTWGIHGGDDNIGEADDSLYDYIAARTPDKGGYIYPIEHQGNTYWNDPVADIEAFYKTHIANIQGKGISTGRDVNGYDSWGYHYFNTNNFNHNGARVCEKYGIKVARLSTGRITNNGDADNLWIGATDLDDSKQLVNGVLCVNGSNFIASSQQSLDPVTDADHYANHISQSWMYGAATSSVPYVHGGNFYNGHDGGNAPGILLFQTMGVMSDFMRSVASWGHPSAYADFNPDIELITSTAVSADGVSGLINSHKLLQAG